MNPLAEWTGLEPATPGVTGRYSNQLNYHSSPAASDRRRALYPTSPRAQPLCHTRSKMPAAPMPVPMHMVTMPYLSFGSRWKACTSVAVRIAPVAPSG